MVLFLGLIELIDWRRHSERGTRCAELDEVSVRIC